MIEPDLQSRVLIYARPSAMDVMPYNINVLPASLSAYQVKTVIIRGKSFNFDVRAVYLSASNPNIFQNLNYSVFDPFSGNPKLYVKNKPFYGVSLSSYNIYDEKTLYFDIPDSIFYYIQNASKPFSTRIDVIIENEAGYGLLSRDSYAYRVSSWSGFVQEQKPCIYGIYVFSG